MSQVEESFTEAFLRHARPAPAVAAA